MKPKAITCEDTTWLVSDARDRELSPTEVAALTHHIEGCERCQVASRQFATLFRELERFLGKSDRD